MNLFSPTSRRRGGLWLDTVIVIAAIALMTLIAIPLYLGGAERARVARAELEVAALAQGQQAVAERFGFYVPLQTLDDFPAIPETRGEGTDDILNEPDSLSLIRLGIAPSDMLGEQPTLSTEDPAVQDLLDEWAGPYAQAKRDYGLDDEGDATRDYPVDPWGTPYRLYSPLGIVGTTATVQTTESMAEGGFSDGVLTEVDDRFDDYAIVSYGPDRVSDSVSMNDDDVIYFISGIVEIDS